MRRDAIVSSSEHSSDSEHINSKVEEERHYNLGTFAQPKLIDVNNTQKPCDTNTKSACLKTLTSQQNTKRGPLQTNAGKSNQDL